MNTTENLEPYNVTMGGDGQLYAEVNKNWQEKAQANKYDFFLKRSQIPKDYYDLELNSYPWVKSVESIRKCQLYIDNFRTEKFKNVSLYLYGLNSSGKTTVACAVGKELIRKGINVRFISAADLTNLFMKTNGFTVESDLQYQIQQLKEVDLLIIDDAFDKTKSTLWESGSRNMIIGWWDSFLRTGISQGQRYIITSNLTLGQVAADWTLGIKTLLIRNFYNLNFLDEVEHIRKSWIESVFD